jgi:hypothetical protein
MRAGRLPVDRQERRGALDRRSGLRPPRSIGAMRACVVVRRLRADPAIDAGEAINDRTPATVRR